MNPLMDTHGRTVRKLRISVTDHCNLRCHYCMPEEGVKFLARKEILSFEELFRISGLFVSLGVEHIRLTGGEPLMRKNLVSFVDMLHSLRAEGLKSIGLTTNAILLTQQLDGLLDKGLDSVNISLDTVDKERFKNLCKRDLYDQTLEGIRHAVKRLPGRVKVNAVIQKDINGDDILPLVDLAHEEGFQLRFIEKMPLDAQNQWERDQVATEQEIRNLLSTRFTLVDSSQERGGAPAEEVILHERNQTLGFISSVTRPFCSQCDRVRLTADGSLRNCLFSTAETPLKSALRSDASDEELIALIRSNIEAKGPGHRINHDDFTRASRSMSQIGG